MACDQSESLRSLLHSIVALSDAEWNWLESRLHKLSYTPGEMLFKPGDVDASIHYLQRGLVRYFYSKEDGRERNHAFATEGNLVACLPAFIGTEPCSFTVEAIEFTHTLTVPSDTVQAFEDRHECWGRMKLRLLEHAAMNKAAREEEFLMDLAETRYRRFLSKYDAFYQRIPQYHIASYLGITPVALSRIRKRINLG